MSIVKTGEADCLIIGFDHNYINGEASLVVARKEGESIKVLNSFMSKEAIDLYYKLVNID